MSDEEINSAEAEAERILEEEFAKLDLTGEDCPMGEECSIHHRKDEKILIDEQRYGRLITYVNDYVVITGDNPELENPALIFRIMTGNIGAEDIPPQYETVVLYVGAEGVMSDLRLLDKAGKKNAIRFFQTHDEWDNFVNAHEAIVGAIEDDLLDLSESALKGDS